MDGQQIWIGTSWKMNKTIDEAQSYITSLAPHLPVPGVQAFVLPPHTALAAVRDALGRDPSLLLGAQNAHWAGEGAGTGEISMRMVRDAGAQLVEIGHSERRRDFGETDQTVARKARAALDHGLTPIICVGEPDPVRTAGRQIEHVLSQLEAAMSLLTGTEEAQVIIAYEPVWAIGDGGEPATPEDIAPMMAAIADAFVDHRRGQQGPRLLYGGGVHPGNATELLQTKHVGGLFVGRAAWSADGLLELLDLGAGHVGQAGN